MMLILILVAVPIVAIVAAIIFIGWLAEREAWPRPQR